MHPIETCVHNSGESAQCTDLRLDKDQQDYRRDNLTNYICTNPKDEEYMINYGNDLREKLIKCESELQKLREK